MNVFDEIGERLKKEKITNILHDIFNEDFIKDWIIETIQTRLENKGIDGEGEILKTNASFRKNNKALRYSDVTIKLKNLSLNANVSLKDTGKFYKSFEVIAKKTFFEVKADFNSKPISENFSIVYKSAKDFETNILALNEEEMIFFIEKLIIPRMIARYINIFTNV